MSEHKKKESRQDTAVRFSLDPNSDIAKRLEPEAIQERVNKTIEMFKSHRVRRC